MATVMGLKTRLELWFVFKVLMSGVQRLDTQSVGARLNAALDRKFGKEAGDQAAKEIAAFLHHVAEELVA